MRKKKRSGKIPPRRKMPIRKPLKKRLAYKAPIKKPSPRIKKKSTNKPLGLRLKRVKGSARRYRDPFTGKTYSRRQFEKLRAIPRRPRANALELTRNYQKLLTLRDIFISSQAKEGIHWTRKEALTSYEFRQIVRGLHSSDKDLRQAAWSEITGGDSAEWTPYIERWVKGGL